jgi:hypothetical protein
MKRYATSTIAFAALANGATTLDPITTRPNLKAVNFDPERDGMEKTKFTHSLPDFAVKGNHECSRT